MMLAGFNDNTLFIIIAALFLLFGIIIFNFNTRMNTLQEHLNNQNTILNDLLNNLGLQLGGNQPSLPPVLAETNINDTYNNNKINVSDNEDDDTDDTDDDSDDSDGSDDTDDTDNDTSNKNEITIVDETDNNVEIKALHIDEIKDTNAPLVEDIKLVELENLNEDNERLNIVNSIDEDDEYDDEDDDEDDDEYENEEHSDTSELLSQMSTNIHNNTLKKLKVTELRDLVISKELVDKSKAKSLTKPQLLDLLN